MPDLWYRRGALVMLGVLCVPTSVLLGNAQARADALEAMRRAEEQRKRAREKENGVRRLLRRIFGGN